MGSRLTIWVLTYTHYGCIPPDMTHLSPAEIIDVLGGPSAVGTGLHVPSTTVSNWKGRNSIPARYHGALVDLGAGKITPEQIVRAHAEIASTPSEAAA